MRCTIELIWCVPRQIFYCHRWILSWCLRIRSVSKSCGTRIVINTLSTVISKQPPFLKERKNGRFWGLEKLWNQDCFGAASFFEERKNGRTHPRDTSSCNIFENLWESDTQIRCPSNGQMWENTWVNAVLFLKSPSRLSGWRPQGPSPEPRTACNYYRRVGLLHGD